MYPECTRYPFWAVVGRRTVFKARIAAEVDDAQRRRQQARDGCRRFSVAFRCAAALFGFLTFLARWWELEAIEGEVQHLKTNRAADSGAFFTSPDLSHARTAASSSTSCAVFKNLLSPPTPLREAVAPSTRAWRAPRGWSGAPSRRWPRAGCGAATAAAADGPSTPSSANHAPPRFRKMMRTGVLLGRR